MTYKESRFNKPSPLVHQIKIHKGEHCKVFLSDLEKLAHDAAVFILNKPHISKEELTGFLHHEFVRAQGILQQQERQK